MTEVLVSAVLLALWVSLGLQGWQRAMAQASAARSQRWAALLLQRQLGRDEGLLRRQARLVGIACAQPERRAQRLQQLAAAVALQAPLAVAEGGRLDRWMELRADELVLRWRLEPVGIERQRHLRLEGLGACALAEAAP
jgi:hypothetical protein